MQYKIRSSDDLLGCSIGYDRKTWYRSAAPSAYDAETAAYAACRLIRHMPALRDRLIGEAVRLGLRSGRGAKALSRRVHTTAQSLALPGGEAWICLTVRQGTVWIRGVRVDAPEERRGKRKKGRMASPSAMR